MKNGAKNNMTVWERPVFLSIPIKVMLTTGVFYISFMTMLLVAFSLFNVGLMDTIAGFPLRSILWGVQILFIAGVASVSTYYFLDRPLSTLRSVMEASKKGNFLVRVPILADDEMGELAESFNKMLRRATDVHISQIETAQDLEMAKRDLKYQASLEEKNKIIQKTNKALGSIVDDLKLLYEIGQSVNSTIELEELYPTVSNVIKKHINIDEFTMLVTDDDKIMMKVKSHFGFAEEAHIGDMTLRVGEGVAGEVAKEGKHIFVKDVRKDNRFLHYKGEHEGRGSFLSIPLQFKRTTLGVINFGRKRTNAFTKDEISMLALVASQVALAIENARLYSKTKELSVRDELTQLFNRRHFQQVMQMEWKRAIRFHRPMSLIMVDVDHFKKYNDSYGHLQGDLVLKEIASVLKRNLREVDTIARFGGEEFIILLPDTDRNGSTIVGEKLRKLVMAHKFSSVEANVTLPPVTISLGISTYPDDVSEMEDLIDHADIALYDAKDSGRNRVANYPQVAGPSDQNIKKSKRPALVN